ncbi:MAG: metal-sulfur cluster assembly factor [Candidatus Micrarchaeota archaeon]
MATEKDVIEALKNCFDPEIGINIYDLGLVYEVMVPDKDKVHIKFSLTFPGCPLEPEIRGQIMAEIGKIKGVKQIIAELVWEPAWNEKMMTPEGHEMIKYLRGF